MIKIISKKHIIVMAGVLLVINLVLVAILLLTKIAGSNFRGFNKIADSKTYQAVFLDNDQIYFGRLKNVTSNSNYLLLTDVYYVKVGNGSVGQLVKLGQIEPHRPTNEMIINREHVLFWENLSSDSPVVQTIRGPQN